MSNLRHVSPKLALTESQDLCATTTPRFIQAQLSAMWDGPPLRGEDVMRHQRAANSSHSKQVP